MLVNETRLKSGFRDPYLRGYVCHRVDRQNDDGGGGVAIFIKISIPHNIFPLPALQNLEAVGISIGTLNLISVYCPPSKLLHSDLLALFSSGRSFIAAGDLNAKDTGWFSRKRNASGRILKDFADPIDLDILAPTEPTYHNFSTGLPDTLDIALVKNPNLTIRLEVIDDLSSDHSPIIMHLGKTNIVKQHRYTYKTDWELYTKHVEKDYGDVPVITSARQIEDEIENFELKIKSAVKAATTRKFVKSQKEKLPKPIRKLIRQRKRARRKAHRTNEPNDRQEVNRLTTEIRHALTNYRDEKWKQKINSLDDDNTQNSLWKTARSIRNAKQKTRVIHGQNGLVYVNTEKAEAFADYMESACRPDLSRTDIDDIEEVENTARRLRTIQNDTHIDPTSPAEVKEILKKLNPRKAPGPDNIPNQALKHLPIKLIVVLTTICNAIFRFQYFPARWKEANVIFIHKPGKDSKYPQNYRPISLLSNISKVVERIFLIRLSKVVENLHLIPDEQFGFRQNHSTIHQLSRVVEYISEGFDKKNSTGAIFLDITKAFDKVWHDGLICKLISFGVPLPMVKFVKSFLRHRSFRAKLNDTLSSSRPLEAGVPQGAVLSPPLFNLFVSDMPVPEYCTLAVYADDTAILCRSLSIPLLKKRLQGAVDALEDWFDRWGITINPEKSTAVLFTKRIKPPKSDKNPQRCISMSGRDIPWQLSAKYLGVHLDKRLNFSTHLNYAIAKGKKAFGALYPIVGRHSPLSIDNKLLLYKSIVRPTFLYASSVWGHLSVTNVKKLQVVQNKFLRAAFDAPWFVTNDQLHHEANLLPISDSIKEGAVKFYGQASTHPNPLVRAAVDYDEEVKGRVNRPKTILT